MEDKESRASSFAADRRFFCWGEPLIPQLIAALQEQAVSRWDFSAEWVVAPTRRSARRLRQSIAECAMAEGRGASAPLVTLPEGLVCPKPPDRPAASPRQMRLAWAVSLLAGHSQELGTLFPGAPQPNGAWALSAARSLMEARTILGEAGLRFEDVAQKLGGDHSEKERWRELARLEEAACRTVHSMGRADPTRTRRRWPASMAAPPGIQRLWVVGCPDLSPLARRYLERWAQTLPVVIAIYADPALDAAFDEWGQPVVEHWNGCTLSWGGSGVEIVGEGDPEGQANRLGQWMAQGSWGAVATVDPEVRVEWDRMLRSTGLSAHDPAGVELSRSSVVRRLGLWADLIESATFETVMELARDPRIFEAAILDRPRGDLGWYGVLQELDTRGAEWLPQDLAALVWRAESADLDATTRAFLMGLEAWRIEAQNEGVSLAAPRFLDRVYLDRVEGEEAFDFLEGVAERVSEAWAEAAALTRLPEGLDAGTLAQWLVAILSEERLELEPEPHAVECLGWLETLWEDDPNIVLAGFNEGLVPESVVGHLLVPDGLRRSLGLRDNGARVARDAYVMESLLRARRDRGAVKLLFGRRSQSGDPLRPSSLLFRLPDDDLAAFVSEHVCGPEAPGTAVSGPRSVPWRYRTAREAEREKPSVAVTGLRDYLQCPFRYYLGHRLGMRREVELGKMEWNAAEFGDLIHQCLEAFGRDPEVRDSEDSDRIANFLRTRIEGLARARHGPTLPGAVAVQLEIAQRRLVWIARRQAAMRRDGWRIFDVERSFATQRFSESLAVTGKIDRIDVHEATGAFRLIDYKTGNQGESPQAIHWARLPKDESEATRWAWAAVGEEAPASRWIDLQLPVYALALRDALGLGSDVALSTGYFVAPLAVTETRLVLWEALNGSVLESADACAGSVLEGIHARRFWPPAPRPKFDAYEALFQGDPLSTFDPESLLAPPSEG